MRVINEPKENDCLYAVHFHQRSVALYAASLFAAKEHAVAYFKPRAKELGLIAVTLMAKPDGVPVVHTPSE